LYQHQSRAYPNGRKRTLAEPILELVILIKRQMETPEILEKLIGSEEYFRK